MALGFNLSFARVATALNDNLSPYLDHLDSVVLSSWMGVVVCVVSFLSAVGVLYMDRPQSRLEAGVKSYEEQKNELRNEDLEEAQSFLKEHEYQNELDISDDPDVSVDGILVESYEEDETIHLEQVNGLSGSFWILCLIIIALYGLLFLSTFKRKVRWFLFFIFVQISSNKNGSQMIHNAQDLSCQCQI